MNRSELRTALRSLLNEDIPGFWTDSQLNTYINLANKRLNSIISNLRADYFTKSVTFTTIPNVKDYALPTDCRFIRRMEIYSTSDPNWIIKLDTLRWPRIEASGDWLFPQAGQPKRYTIVGQAFHLYPIPDSGYAIRIYYDFKQDEINQDTDSPVAPVDFHDMIVYWAGVLAQKQNNEADAEFTALFDIRKAELIESLISREGEDPVTVESYLEGII